jgi:hypothetical protein
MVNKSPKSKPAPKKAQPLMISSKFYRINPKNGQKYKAGMFVAESRNDGKIMIGFSFCNYYKGDKYDYINKVQRKHLGFRIARERAIRWHNEKNYLIGPFIEGDERFGDVLRIPRFACKEFDRFLRRCDRYFKFYEQTKGKIMYPVWVDMYKSQEHTKR